MQSFPRCVTLTKGCRNMSSTFAGWHPILVLLLTLIRLRFPERKSAPLVTNLTFEKHFVFSAVSHSKDGSLLHLNMWRHSETVAYVSLPRSALNKLARVLTKCSQRSTEVSSGQLSHHSPGFPDRQGRSYSRCSLAQLHYYRYPGIETSAQESTKAPADLRRDFSGIRIQSAIQYPK